MELDLPTAREVQEGRVATRRGPLCGQSALSLTQDLEQPFEGADPDITVSHGRHLERADRSAGGLKPEPARSVSGDSERPAKEVGVLILARDARDWLRACLVNESDLNGKISSARGRSTFDGRIWNAVIIRGQPLPQGGKICINARDLERFAKPR